MKLPASSPFPRRWPLPGLTALLLILLAASTVIWTGSSPASAQDGSEPPAKPTGLSATTEPGLLDVALDWNDVDGAARYWVRWRSVDSGEKLNDGIEVKASDAAITVAGYGDWVARVQACNGAGCGEPLAQRFTVEPAPQQTPAPEPTPTAAPTPEPTPEPVPTRPTGLSIATEPGSLDVSLDWDDVDGAARYWVRWRSADSGEKLNDGIEVETSRTAITVADYGYWVARVQGCNDTGCGEPLAKEFTVEPEPTPAPEPEPSAPGQPANLAVSATRGELDLSATWDTVDGATLYKLSWLPDEGDSPPDRAAWASTSNAVWVSTNGVTVTVSGYGQWVVRLEGCNDTGCGPAVFQQLEVEPPNRAPVVDTQAANYADFTYKGNAPRGVIVSKRFHGIFSDPDGDELIYSVSMPEHQLPLADTLQIHPDGQSDSQAAQSDRPIGHVQRVFFTADAGDDWKAISPALEDPLTVTVTLTATDPEGLSASVSGDFLIDWESGPDLPGKPQNLALSAEPGELDLWAMWDTVEGATSYKLRWRQPGGEFEEANAMTVSETEAAIAVSGYGQWEVQLQGCNDAGCGPEAVSQLAVEPPRVARGYRGQLAEVLVELSQRRPGQRQRTARTEGPSAQSSHTTSIVYVIDDSGSMDGDFPEVRTALRAVRGETMTNTKVALIAFGTAPTTVFGLTAHSSDATNGPWTDARINAFGGKRGGTYYKEPLENAKALLDSDTDATVTTKKIIFLTDAQVDRPAAAVQAIIDAGIIVDTIGFGDHYSDNFSVIEKIATDTGGAYRAVTKPSQGTTNSPAVTAKSLSDILTGTVADNTATLFLVDNSFSVYWRNEAALDPALTAAADKAAESSGTGRQVGLAVFLGETTLTTTYPDLEEYSRYRVAHAVGSSSLSMPGDIADTGSTDIDHALSQAYTTISGATATNKRVVLITDGISAVDVQAATLNSYKNDSATTLDVVAWGEHADRVQLKTWADSASGTFSVVKPGPAAPKGVTGADGEGTITLSWNDPSDSAITKYQYRAWMWFGGGWSEWVDIPGTGATTTWHIFTGLPDDGHYYVQLRGVRDDIPGAPSLPVFLRSMPHGIGLTATSGNGQIALSWNDPSDSAITKYQYAQRSGDGAWSAWTDISGSGASTTSHTVAGLTNDTEYTIALRAVRGTGDTATYGPVSAVTATPSS